MKAHGENKRHFLNGNKDGSGKKQNKKIQNKFVKPHVRLSHKYHTAM